MAVWTGGRGETPRSRPQPHRPRRHLVGGRPRPPAPLSLVIPDLPGHANSAPREGPLTLRGELDGVAAAIRERGGPDPVVLVGNALGGWLSLMYAREHPERVERLVLVNSVGLSIDLGDVPLQPTNREEARRFVAALFAPDSRPKANFILDNLIQKTAKGPFSRLLGNLRSTDMLDNRLPEIRVPANLIWGEADGIVRRETTARLLDGLPAARLHSIPGCGHLPQVECPREFERILQEILATPPPAVPAPFPLP